MAQTVDLALLRQVTADSMRVYEAIKRGQTLTAESGQILTIAEGLLRQAGLAYLLEGVEFEPGQPVDHSTDSHTAPEGMVSTYVQIQQVYADLKDALYRLAKIQMNAEAWEDARTMLAALLEIEPEYRDAATLLRQGFLTESKSLFEQREWEKGRTILRQGLADREVKLEYLNSFLEEDVSIDGLRSLLREEPGVSKLPSFQRAMNRANEWQEAYSALWSLEFPHEPFIWPSDSEEEKQQKRAEYERLKAQWDPREREVDALYNIFYESLRDLQAELPLLFSDPK